MPLIDSFGRTIDYLRVSVTDRCNFRCVYCMPEEGATVVNSERLLTAGEIERALRIAVQLGISKVRITGGEPLIRRDILDVVERLGRIPGIEDLSLTTNAFLLGRYAKSFADAGMHRVNISLDTLNPDRFRRLARGGDFDTVWHGIEAAVAARLTPIKLNCVVMRGLNDDEAASFAALTLDQPYHVRFIELMPINWSAGDDRPTAGPLRGSGSAGTGSGAITLYADVDAASFKSNFKMQPPSSAPNLLDGAAMRRAYVSSADTRIQIESVFGNLEPASLRNNGPAKSFRLPGSQGTISFISQISNDMCEQCNRIRLTADGQLRPCLMADGEVDILLALRCGASDAEIADLFRVAVHHKPREHRLEDGLAPMSRFMSQIGG